MRETLQPIVTSAANISGVIQGGGVVEEDSQIQENNYEQNDLSEEAGEEEEEQMAVLAKQECMSPGYIIRRQRSSVESFAWDPNYASDVI